MLLNVATYLISLLAHAIYPTYLIKLYVLSNVCILDFTQISYCASVDRAVAYVARCCIGILWHRSGSACPAAGVCDAFVSSRMNVCMCGRRAAHARVFGLSHYIAPTYMVLDHIFLEQFGDVDSNSLLFIK